MMVDDDAVLVGNNEDYIIPHTRIWFVPAENGNYGRVYFGFDNWLPQGGMNDQGLFFDFFATQPLDIEKSRDKPKFKGSMIDMMAATCATVEAVINLFEGYNLEFMSKFQMFIVDRTGDAAIIEGDEIVRKSGVYQIVTGFHQSKVPEDRRPCTWHQWGCKQYKIAESMLADIEIPTIADFREILKATHRDTTRVETLYSNIYDLRQGRVYLYCLHDFDKEVVIDLKEELQKGRHYYILPALFGKDQPYSYKTYRNASPSLSVSYPTHFKVAEHKGNEVLRVQSPHSGTPLLTVIVDDQPPDVELDDLWEMHLQGEIEAFATGVKRIFTKQTKLREGIPATEIRFDWVAEGQWPLKTLILATYYQDKLVLTAATALAHPEFFKDFLYSLKFD